jgi:hypothetical protein
MGETNKMRCIVEIAWSEQSLIGSLLKKWIEVVSFTGRRSGKSVQAGGTV